MRVETIQVVEGVDPNGEGTEKQIEVRLLFWPSELSDAWGELGAALRKAGDDPVELATTPGNLPNDAYQVATIAAHMVERANAEAESYNQQIHILLATAKDLGYDLANVYSWDPDTFLPKRGTGLVLLVGQKNE